MDNENQKHLENLNEIRSIMERSSSFLSLSGLSGIFAGTFALIGVAFAYWYVYIYHAIDQRALIFNSINFDYKITIILLIDATIVLSLAIIVGYFFTYRNSKKKGLKMWNITSKKLITALLIPLVTGGIFSLILIWHGATFIISATTLIFYGLALINASKFTVNDVRYLGISQVILGLIASIDIGFGLLYWAIGFGVMHIIYGAIMYFRYEKK